MAQTHELKTIQPYFDAVLRGDKTFEVRKNDRDFQAGDTLILKEWNSGGAPGTERFTGRELVVVVSYVFIDNTDRYGLSRFFCILGFKSVSLRAD